MFQFEALGGAVNHVWSWGGFGGDGCRLGINVHGTDSGIWARREKLLLYNIIDSQPGAILSPRKHLAISGDNFGCHSWRERGRESEHAGARMLLTSSGERPGTAPHDKKILQPKISIVLRLRNPDVYM